MAVSTKKNYALLGGLTNSAWIEENTPIGEVFDHLTQLYSLVYEGMSTVSPEFRDFGFDRIELIISEEYRSGLSDAMFETKRMVDNYLLNAGFPCSMEFAGGNALLAV
ncbi:MAG: hypothetical protein JXA95_05565 [Spirochaetales bacterium]|nr:hypothetical protein [Spirochaetales bacterium]